MNKNKKAFLVSLAGTIIIAVCCFTPFLVLVLGVIGLSIMIPYLDYLLLPALGLFILITIFAFIRWEKSGKGLL
ncbi:MAG: mercury resistance system transport protein MerF [Nitrospirota bacterium]